MREVKGIYAVNEMIYERCVVYVVVCGTRLLFKIFDVVWRCGFGESCTSFGFLHVLDGVDVRIESIGCKSLVEIGGSDYLGRIFLKCNSQYKLGELYAIYNYTMPS